MPKSDPLNDNDKIENLQHFLDPEVAKSPKQEESDQDLNYLDSDNR